MNRIGDPMSLLQLPQEKIFYISRHKDSGFPSLLFIHGAGGNHRHWLYQWHALAQQGFEVYALDLPGHGKSTGEPGGSLESYAESVISFCQLLGLKQPILIGHSMGGAIALLVAISGRLSCRGLILLGTGAELPEANNLLKLLQQENGLQLMLAQLYGDDVKKAQEKAYLELHKIPKKTLLCDFKSCAKVKLPTTKLQKLNLPVSIIVGTKDQVTPPTLSQALHHFIPGSELHLIAGGNHMLMFQHPLKITEKILNFCHSNFN
ncbi:alpha/beta fold hydrolase [Zhaonella formicivorans]|uniref:alpha/beta fold hydrolase n=1 Tax=Zhaonella formicivorans TaxID=2528593 RepID=UPI001D0FE71B|nr:alpha/beta hydrolase [Zhaonella formicivorans]